MKKMKWLLAICLVLALVSLSMVSAAAEVSVVVNGQQYPLPEDQAVEIIEGRSYVPLRVLAELLGVAVEWDASEKTIQLMLANNQAADKNKPELIPEAVNIDEWGGANAYESAGDNPASHYYVNPDFYRMKSDDQLTLLENFKTYQQTAEWSCGPASALMVLWHFGITDYNEWDISVMMDAHTDLDDPDAEPGSANEFGEYGTDVGQMTRFFENLAGFEVVETSYRDNYSAQDLIQEGDPSHVAAEWGNLPPTFSYMSLYATENDDKSEDWADAADSYFVRWLTGHLEAGRPIMVEWVDWDGHWQVIIGYDNNGTPEIGDDILIFADPYDVSDHWQDGYYYYPLERWFYMWHDRNIAPKPYQLQPYLVVDLVS
ncbi:stalk domain-containing protein [Anoxynatronum sibiricum]|uniref:Stalk domain-containing protein n=1 Tax=Anoxynatronum sibiricum TaxID=210623 RepID=A0ABU9VVW4_9CLOT